MHSTIKRVLFYMALMAVALSIAIFFTETRSAFVTLLAFAFAVGIFGELLFWAHIIRVAWNRRNPSN